jgi:hypothetical protein
VAPEAPPGAGALLLWDGGAATELAGGDTTTELAAPEFTLDTGLAGALDDAAAPPAAELGLEGPVGVSPALTQPLFAVISAGHATGLKSTLGLSPPPNQSYLQ